MNWIGWRGGRTLTCVQVALFLTTGFFFIWVGFHPGEIGGGASRYRWVGELLSLSAIGNTSPLALLLAAYLLFEGWRMVMRWAEQAAARIEAFGLRTFRWPFGVLHRWEDIETVKFASQKRHVGMFISVNVSSLLIGKVGGDWTRIAGVSGKKEEQDRFLAAVAERLSSTR